MASRSTRIMQLGEKDTIEAIVVTTSNPKGSTKAARNINRFSTHLEEQQPIVFYSVRVTTGYSCNEVPPTLILSLLESHYYKGFGVWGLGFGVWGLGDR